MPAVDDCEPQVIRALEKADWVVVDRPYSIQLVEKTSRYVFADLRLESVQNNDEMIVVEVKCFPTSRSQIDEFYHAFGQYVVYRHALRLRGISTPIYLTMPDAAYKVLIQIPAIQAALVDSDVKIILVDLASETITQWIP